MNIFTTIPMPNFNQSYPVPGNGASKVKVIPESQIIQVYQQLTRSELKIWIYWSFLFTDESRTIIREKQETKERKSINCYTHDHWWWPADHGVRVSDQVSKKCINSKAVLNTHLICILKMKFWIDTFFYVLYTYAYIWCVNHIFIT